MVLFHWNTRMGESPARDASIRSRLLAWRSELQLVPLVAKRMVVRRVRSHGLDSRRATVYRTHKTAGIRSAGVTEESNGRAIQLAEASAERNKRRREPTEKGSEINASKRTRKNGRASTWSWRRLRLSEVRSQAAPYSGNSLLCDELSQVRGQDDKGMK